MMNEEKKSRVLLKLSAFLIMASVVFCDYVSKAAAVEKLGRAGESRTVIKGVLDFTYVLNSGATAGILSDRRWVFMTVSALIIIGAIVYIIFSKKIRPLTCISGAIIIGGGIGNMIDRVSTGEVVDFIDVTCFDFFPFNTVFNVADVCVCCGCVLLIIAVICEEIRDAKEKKEKEEKSTNTGRDIHKDEENGGLNE